jgi:hypothetical protein
MISRLLVLALIEGGAYLGGTYQNDVVWRSFVKYPRNALD